MDPRSGQAWHEREPADDAAVLEAAVRLVGALERERAREDGLELARGDEGEDVLEVGARGARGAGDRDLVQDRVARVELDLLRVEIPDEDDASSAPHAAERALPRGRAGELEGEVAATALGEATDLVIEAHTAA